VNLLTRKLRNRLIENGLFNDARRKRGERPVDLLPVVKLYFPWSGAMFLLTEIDPQDDDRAFGLCDFGLGSPQLGSLRLHEIMLFDAPGKQHVERDRHFKPAKSLGAYAAEALVARRILA
jgi:Protein of unknown function (DUF2958)